MVSRIPARSLLLALLLAACGDNPAGPIPGGGDPENISLVRVVLGPEGGGEALESTRVDPDGAQLPLPPGPATATLALRQGVTYTGHVEILNELDPEAVVNVVEEIEAEANFHRFFYTLSCPGVTVPVASFNVDTQIPPAPLGTTFRLVVAADAPPTGSCTLTIELRHFETNKGDGTGPNFETDLALEFPVSVSP